MTDYFKFRKYNLHNLTTPPVAAPTTKPPADQNFNEDDTSAVAFLAAPEDSKDGLSDSPDHVPVSVPVPGSNISKDQDSVPAQSRGSSKSPSPAVGTSHELSVETDSAAGKNQSQLRVMVGGFDTGVETQGEETSALDNEAKYCLT